MLLWFVVIAAAGIPLIVKHPDVLLGLSPTWAISFLIAHPVTTFVAIGAVVLVITGAEALYADMGHFGRVPIRRAWFFVVFPALVLNYLGQAALVLDDPSTTKDPFFLLFPAGAATARRHPRDRCDGHRQPGRDLGRVLPHPAGGAARAAATADDPPDLQEARAGRSSCPPSTCCCSSA